MTTSGNVSEHSTGNAVDIAMINGQPVLGNQGPGTLSEALVKDLLSSRATMKPHQIISLMDYFGADNTFAMADHDDHIHVGYMPVSGPGSGSASKQFSEILKPEKWKRLIQRLGEIDNPTVPDVAVRRRAARRQGQGRQGRRQARLRRPPRRVAATLLFPFVQLELAGTVGLEDGRYLGREPERVLVVRVADAPPQPRRRLGRAKPKNADPEARGRPCRGRR